MKRMLLALAAGAALSSVSTAAETGFLDRSIALAGQRYLYQVYVPLNWAPTQKWPVVLYLHGSAGNGSDGIPLRSALITAIHADRDRFPAVIVFPQARVGSRWSTPAMQDMVLAQLDSAIKEFNGDPTRVYLTGFSMGGGGVVRIASRWPERFAALIDISGGISLFNATTTESQALNDEDVTTHAYLRSADLYQEVATIIRGIPVWVFHGDADQNVPVEESRRLVAALKAVGANVRYTEYRGLDHNPTPPQAWGEKGLSEWLFAQHRPDANK